MLHDLAKGPRTSEITGAVCVVGGGLAGLVLGSALARRKVDVVVLESGGSSHPSGPHDLNEVICTHTRYDGATRGRARGLGGTGAVWGGALIPFLPADLESRPWLGLEPWPVHYQDIARYFRAVEQYFDVEEGSFEEERCDTVAKKPTIYDLECFSVRLAKWPRHKKRNLRLALWNDICMAEHLRVYVNATAVDMVLCNDGWSVLEIQARSPEGNEIRIKARHFVFAAGAIESTRLMLLLDRKSGGRVRDLSPSLGQYFVDHVSMPVGRIRVDKKSALQILNKLLGFRFGRGTLRSVRFELKPAVQRRLGFPSAFAHIAPVPSRQGAYDALRALVRDIQRGRVPEPRTIGAIVTDAQYLLRLLDWRLRHKRLPWPDTPTLEVHVVIEQIPSQDRTITLACERDRFGVEKASIHWYVTKEERDALWEIAKCFARDMNNFFIASGIGAEVLLGRAEANDNLAGCDIYHPAGTTRMAVQPEKGVVDENLLVFAIKNVSVVSTSVFPSLPSANPTFTLLALALRHADWLSKSLAKHDNAAARSACRG